MSLERKDMPYVSSHQLIQDLLNVDDDDICDVKVKQEAPFVPKTIEIKQEPKQKSQEFLYWNESFICVSLWPEDKLSKNYQAILAVDVDDIIIDEEQSRKAHKPVFIHKDKLKQSIKYAVEHNVLVVIVTTRYYELPDSDNALFVRNILKELGCMEHIAKIFFTAEKSKYFVLHHLWGVHYKFDWSKKLSICLYDARLVPNIQEVCGEFTTILADKNDPHAKGLEHLQCFMKGRPFPRVGAADIQKLSLSAKVIKEEVDKEAKTAAP